MKTTVLAVLSSREHQASLRGIADQSDWDLNFVQTFQDARAALHEARAAVVISECCLPEGCSWRDLLNEIRILANPPRLIVASLSAEDRLWAEVLNLGAYDLIVLPFDATDVIHVVNSAWLSWKLEPPAEGHNPTAAGGRMETRSSAA